MTKNEIKEKIQIFKPADPADNWEEDWLKLISTADPDDIIECAEILANIIAEERAKSPVIDFWDQAAPDYFHNTLDYLREQYDGGYTKTIEDAEAELDYLYPADGMEKTVTEGIIARAKQLREIKKRKSAESCCGEEKKAASIYEKSLSEKDIDGMLLLMKVIAFNDLDEKIKAKGEETCNDVWLENRVLLKHGISTDVVNGRKLYTLISDHTHMPLICDDFSGGQNCLYLCTEKERADQLAEYRKSAHGEDCSAAEMDLDGMFRYLLLYGYEAVRFVPELSSSILLSIDDLFDALDDIKVYTQYCMENPISDPELSISVLKFYQRLGDYKGSAPENNDELVELSKQVSHSLEGKSLFAPVVNNNDEGDKVHHGWNVCAEFSRIDGSSKHYCTFYSDLYTLKQRYAPCMNYVRANLAQLISVLHVTHFLLRIGAFEKLFTVEDLLCTATDEKDIDHDGQ